MVGALGSVLGNPLDENIDGVSDGSLRVDRNGRNVWRDVEGRGLFWDDLKGEYRRWLHC